MPLPQTDKQRRAWARASLIAKQIAQGATRSCPVLGQITPVQCAYHRNRTFAATNHWRVVLHRTCPTCPNNQRRK